MVRAVNPVVEATGRMVRVANPAAEATEVGAFWLGNTSLECWAVEEIYWNGLTSVRDLLTEKVATASAARATVTVGRT